LWDNTNGGDMTKKNGKEIKVKVFGLFSFECKELTFNEIRTLLYLISVIAFLLLVLLRIIYSFL